MKKTVLPAILTFCLFLSGCNNDKEILQFFDEWDAVAAEMVKKIEAGDIDAARAVFDAKKESLKSGWKKIARKTSGSNTKIYMSKAVKKRYDESFFNNLTAVTTAATTLEIKLADNRAQREKLQNLVTEYRAIFK